MATNPIWVTLITVSLGGLLAGLLTLVGVMITQRHARLREDARWHRECEREQTRWTREDAERTRQRLADSYLEVLRIVEREAQWIEASITNWRIAAEEAECRTPDHEPEPFERVKVPEPAVTDRATIAAHLAAFGSDNVRRLYQAWRGTIAAIENENENLTAEARLSYPDGPYISQWGELRALQPNELGARQALANAIAVELGHR